MLGRCLPAIAFSHHRGYLSDTFDCRFLIQDDHLIFLCGITLVEMPQVLFYHEFDFIQIPKCDLKQVGVLVEFFDRSFDLQYVFGEINYDGFIPRSFSGRIISVFFPS